jgi:hypothetical protein
MQKAHALAELVAEDVEKDAYFSSLLEQYMNALAASREIMERSGMVDICSACAAKVEGGCCFREVEEWYDPVLLLVNLLLKAELPDSEAVSGNCIFLGERGCRIPARYHFCVNFLCDRLRREIRSDLMQEVYAATGRELSLGCELELALRRHLCAKGVDPDDPGGHKAP